MTVLHTHFDGQKIITPQGLIGSPPREVEVVLRDEPIAAEAGVPESFNSVWDVIGRVKNPKSGEELDNTLKQERASWRD